MKQVFGISAENAQHSNIAGYFSLSYCSNPEKGRLSTVLNLRQYGKSGSFFTISKKSNQ
jgi:hypothetical protein